jgi:glycosyltransferase involved in cell wall biosynthesis
MTASANIPSATKQARFTVLQLIPSMQSGGAEQSCIDVTAAITQAGGQAIVATAGGRWVPELIRAGAKVILLPLRSKNPFTLWRNAARIEKIIREHNVDIVHARSRAPAWSGSWACQRTNVPFMTTFHAAYHFDSRFKHRYNSIMARGVRIIAISQYISQHILDHYDVSPSKIRIIYRGTPMEKFHPNMIHPERLIKLAREWQIPDDKQLILMPSRLTRIKGHHVLIEALAKMKRKDVFCIICGATPERDHYQDELMQLIVRHNLTKQVRIVGICSDMPAAMRLAQLVVAPSLVPEGFGRIPVEAQAMGTPCVASAIGGHNEIMVHNETGWLVPPDDPSAMAAAMMRALDMTDRERASLATKAMGFVSQHFTREQMTAQTLAVYTEILDEARAKSTKKIKKAA